MKRNIFILGMPVQFMLVVFAAALLVLYVVAMSASIRVEKRNDIRNVEVHTETYAWESTALWMCPLH